MTASEGAVWRKSNHSGDGGCVEVAPLGERIGLRDSKAGGAGPILTFTPQRWSQFVAAVTSGAVGTTNASR